MTQRLPRQPLPNLTRAIVRYRSDELFRGATTATIEHQGHCYLLRITRQGKLILTK